jgi:hypothetical protein
MRLRGWSEDRKFRPGAHWDFNRFRTLPLKDRFIKRSLLQAIIEHQYENRYHDRPKLALWSKLDFWYNCRNSIIHGAQGINEDRMKRLPKQYPGEAKDACGYEEILSVMRDILSEVGTSTFTNDYYLYAQIRDWALDRLK